MAEKGYDMVDLANNTGIHQTLLGKYARGKTVPKSKNYHRLNDALGGLPPVQVTIKKRRVAQELPPKVNGTPVTTDPDKLKAVMSNTFDLLTREQQRELVQLAVSML
jgi:hypothetical protein